MEKKQNEIKLNVIENEEQKDPIEKHHTIQNESKKSKLEIFKKIQFWQISNIIFIILFITSLFFISDSNNISEKEARNTVHNYVDKVLSGRTIATIGSVTKKSGLYKVDITIQGQNIESYITKDGELFFPAAVELAKIDRILPTGNVIRDNENIQNAKRGEVSVDDDPIIGDPKAPVTIIEFSDFQCPFCKKFVEDTFEDIKKEYINTGKVKLVYRDFPLQKIHSDAQKAAEAAECADDQGKFWEYHDKLFENQKNLDEKSLKKYAEELKLDTNKFNECIDSEKMADEVSKDMADGISYGVEGTPTFFINGISVTGAVPFDNFKIIIEKELTGQTSKIQ